ncbi:MAG: AsnC family protein [Pseudomonadales bacterium]|nr:AsnC family protein [Pseudomonadales bacterium]
MVAGVLEYELRKILQEGLPLVEKPYQEIARQLAVSEQVVIEKIAELKRQGLIKRFGMVLRHHELGYAANCMVVWDIPDDRVDQVAERLANSACVTLCYQRPRRDKWSYNLFCMIHGKERAQVERQLQEMIEAHQLDYPHQLLFSSRRFKQRGARYV